MVSIPLGAALVTIFVVTGVANSINIIDGFNGLSSMCAMLILGALAYVAFQVGDLSVMHRAHNALTTPGTGIEPTTGEVHLRHHISPTGFYRGRKVLKAKTDA